MIWIPNGWAGRLGGGGRALRAVAFNVSINVAGLAPGVTAGIGLGEMVESPGRPETVKFTAFPKPFASIGPTVTLIIVDCPAVMVVGFADMVALKSSAVKVSCCVLAPPPGAGFVTLTFGVPPAVMSVAGTLTTICVGVTEAESGVIAAFEPNVMLLTPLTKPVPVIVNWNVVTRHAVASDRIVIKDRGCRGSWIRSAAGVATAVGLGNGQRIQNVVGQSLRLVVELLPYKRHDASKGRGRDGSATNLIKPGVARWLTTEVEAKKVAVMIGGSRQGDIRHSTRSYAGHSELTQRCLEPCNV